MKTSLDELTMQEFISLLCGDLSVLGSGSRENLERAGREIIMKYRVITDKHGVTENFLLIEGVARCKMEMMIYDVARRLLNLGETESVIEVLTEIGIRLPGTSQEILGAVIESSIARTEHELGKLMEKVPQDEEEKSPEVIRQQFSELTAALMAHFKFQIDIGTMKADIYAHLVARQWAELKMQYEAMKKRK